MVHQILKVINKEKELTDSKNSFKDENFNGDLQFALPYMHNEEKQMFCSHNIFFVGDDEEIRQNAIKQLVSYKNSACFVLKKRGVI